MVDFKTRPIEYIDGIPVFCKEDEYISNAGEVSVCEGIVFYGPEIYNKALLYALPETKKSLQKLNEYYNSSPT